MRYTSWASPDLTAPFLLKKKALYRYVMCFLCNNIQMLDENFGGAAPNPPMTTALIYYITARSMGREKQEQEDDSTNMYRNKAFVILHCIEAACGT